MQYRKLGNTGISVSRVGLGCEHLQGKPRAQIFAVIDRAVECGVNVFDVIIADPLSRDDIGAAFKPHRKDLILQAHIGLTWENGQFARSRDLAICARYFEDYLKRLGTDYIDIGMLHFVDTDEDFRSVFESGIIEYALRLKREGVIRAIGMGSHNPLTAKRAVRTGLVDMIMFSINPAYDMLPDELNLDDIGSPDMITKSGSDSVNPERSELYALCESTGVGINVMKSYAGGLLLADERSPFGAALTPAQCIHYGLTRPGVSSVLVGCATVDELDAALSYENADDSQRDYAGILGRVPKFSVKGACVYCNHCLPCPAQIDIAQVNKYYDLAALSGGTPTLAAEHYGLLSAHASDCTQCGECEQRCPFDVAVIERMERTRQMFGI